MSPETHAGFSSKLGGVLAAAGSAIGLGNIWRFPMQAGQNGGSAFILVYIICILCFGIPLLISEFVIGRHARANVGNAYRVLAPNTFWRYIGPFTVLIAFLILCYYNVVAGWVLDYTYDAVVGNFALNPADYGDANPYADNFINFVTNPWKPIICLVLFMAATHYVVTRGVEKGIERFSKILMPILCVIMILLVIFALNMPGAEKGLSFLFSLKFEDITPSVVLSALAQCFYSLSLGMGIVTYASYFKKEANLARTATSIAFMDTLVAILAGIIIFPAVFSVSGIEPQAGASLVFISLPNVFNSALSSMPILAWLMPVLFYGLLMVATITSCIFLHEVATAYVAENFGFTRHRAALIVSIFAIALGICCSLSMGIWSDFKIFDLNLFDLFDSVTAKIMLPVSGVLVCLFVGRKMTRKQLITELSSYGAIRVKFLGPLLFAVKYFAPLTIALIMISQF
ncbi:MAG: sodium-dependent transporter [Succinivibrio sp.]|nr:sodium-dependent transporter [Succinivibrio sp.]